MKSFYCAAILVAAAAAPLAAEGLYFDIGVGAGAAKTEFDGADASSGYGSSVDEAAVELGLKLGYGPFGSTPLYVVGELEGIGHRFDDGYNYVQYNSYMVGPGIIYYPIPLIQLAASLGYSWINNETDLPGYTFYDSTGGYAGNVSAAFDWGNENHALLLGLKLSYFKNTLEITAVEDVQTFFGVFVRYAYRQKLEQE